MNRRPFFRINTNRTLLYVFFLAMLAGVYAAIPTALVYSRHGESFHTSSQFHAVLTIVVGCLLVFRTNTAYSRWWEARTLWGSLVNTSRNLAIKFTTIVPQSDAERAITNLLVKSFSVSLRHHLRDETKADWPTMFTEQLGHPNHVPQAIAKRLYQIAKSAKDQGRIDGDEFRVVDTDLVKLMEICGACERILRTRIVKSYRIFARQCAIIFLASLPWGIANDFKAYTILLTIITAYFMLGLEIVAEHVEEPFGYDEDDLDLEGMCRTIQVSVDEVFSGNYLECPTPDESIVSI